MKPVVLSRATFHTWLKSPPRYSVLMVKSDECVPCGRVLPIFEKYANVWGTEYDVQFGTYTINWKDKDFVYNTLGIKVTPTFQVYDGGNKVYSLSSATRIGELKNFLLENVPFKELDM
jgi:thiol-disulfide isomerase/thioredoxin